MKTLLIAALALFTAATAQAEDDFNPIGSGALLAGDLAIRVVKYEDILSSPGSKLKCLKEDGRYGYQVTRLGDGDYLIDMISDGKLEGEKSRMRAVLKDYGSPFIVYLSVYKRDEDYGSYFELLIDKKVNIFLGSLAGDAMFTEAYYEKVDGKEHETLKPIAKFRMKCEAVE
jgi:hypothetical protein